MKNMQQSISHMNQLLDDLVETSTIMRDVSMQVISEEELAPLQKKQQLLLRELENFDEALQKNYPGQINESTHTHFHERLADFQRLNKEFIQNLNQSHGLIQFDLEYLSNETNGEIPSLSFLHKVTTTPNATETVEAKKNKEK
jgi:hypothetical protein